ncbi:ABC transporter permease [Bacillus timonensis]|nr:ABC transporter permease [Bacillus timonensis]
MKQWVVLFRKEWIEMVRNFKLIWMPLIFILLGLLQPITSYYLPTILESAGDLPEGAVIDIPLPSSEEVIIQTLGQYSQIGVLILALAFMGIIAGERNSGVAGMVLVKPVSYTNYITAKWLSATLVGLLSYFLGMLAAWYYTILLIGEIVFADFMSGTIVYGIWLLFLITLTVLFSSFFKSGGLVAFFTIVCAIALSAVTALAKKWMLWSPANLSNYANSIILTGNTGEHFILVLITSIVLILIFLLLSIQLFQRKELTE